MSAGKKNMKSDSLGVKIVSRKTEIQYANGKLTEDGFKQGIEYGKGICYRGDLSYKTERPLGLMYDLGAFIRLCTNLEFLSDGLIWGIVLNTLPVISQLLTEIKCCKPVVFFIGESGTFKTSVARAFLTTGEYRNKQFIPFKVTAPVSIKDLKKETENIHASLVLFDDIHEMFSYSAKKKIQDSIESVCNDFCDYTNDCALVATIKKGSNLEFSDSLLQRVVFVDFSGVMKASFEDKQLYFSFMDFESDKIPRMMTAYQLFLVRKINERDIKSDHINNLRKSVRDKYKNESERWNDIIALFDYSLTCFSAFCSVNGISKELLDEFHKDIRLTAKRTLLQHSDVNFSVISLEKRILHCLEYMGQSKDFVIIKPEKCKLCRNFKPYTNDSDIECAKFHQTLSENNIGNMYMNISCQLRRGASNCRNLDLIESYQPEDMYLNSNWKRNAVLLEYLEDSELSTLAFYHRLYKGGDYSLMIAAVKPFQRELRRLYIRECQKHNIEAYELSERDITTSLNKLGIIAYTTRKYEGSKERKDYVFSDEYPSESVYILRLPLEICNKISKNIDEFDRSNINYDNTLNSKFTENEEKNLYKFFTNLTRIKFEERK